MSLKGVLHCGAHECEEMVAYRKHGLTEKDVIWFEANNDLVNKMKIINPNYHIENFAVYNESDKILNFNVTNNFQSSSLLPLKTHSKHYPGIKVVQKFNVNTIRLDDYFSRNGIDHTKYNFLNMDIQGAELTAIQGMGETIKDFEMLYLEVNKEELYEGCGLVVDLDEYLLEKGFVRLDTKWVKEGWGDAFYLRRDIYRQKIKENPSLMN